jgi:hypothetical protein
MDFDEALAAEVMLVSSAIRQAIDGLQNGQYESFESAMEALCGFRPVLVEGESGAPDWDRVVIHHDVRTAVKGAKGDDG